MKYLLFFALLSSSLHAADVTVQNRVLAKVNGKAITVMDVTKKMDLYLLKANPDAFSQPQLRYQFYRGSWRDMLLDMVDRELVLKEAVERGMPVSPGDVREELEALFGPNVLMNLEKAGLTYEEASEMIKSEITIRRMLMWRVNSRVESSVTPEDVQKAYEQYVRDGVHREEYVYQMLTFRSVDVEKAQIAAESAFNLLTNDKVALQDIPGKLQTDLVTVSVSEPMTQRKKEIVPLIQAVLQPLEKGAWSTPKVQKARDGSQIVRLYFLQDKSTSSPESFAAISETLKREITNKRMNEEQSAYFSRLRRHFNMNIDELAKDLPSQFEPYAIQ